ncbi:MAG TPA: DUF3579 domain-containing protein [Burkholderiales bacterium]
MSGILSEIVIVGITTSGQVFRPSDWAERLCGCMALFGEDQRITYSPYVKPIIAGDVKCVVVDRRLEQIDVEAFGFLMAFARDNELQLRDGRQEIRHTAKARPRVHAA